MWKVVFLFAVAVGASGCELQKSCDPATDPACHPPAKDAASDGDAATVEGQPYVYVFLEDLMVDDRAGTGGVDLLGIELIQNGASSYASQIHQCELGALDNSLADNCNVAQGVPPDPTQACPATPTAGQAEFVSLGGVGGALIVSFGLLKEITQGDQLRVHACPRLAEEPYNLYVGTAPAVADPNWVACIQNGVGETACTVPELPLVPID